MAREMKLSTLGKFAGGGAVAVATAWAFATLAAQHIMAPHLEAAKIRVHIMCQNALVQNQNIEAICIATGAKCSTLDPRVLLASCEEP